MHFDATLLGLALSAIGTTVVIVGAVAAVWQLRYIRHGNELATLTQLDEEFNEPDMVRAKDFVRFELAAAMSDPAFFADLRSKQATTGAQSVIKVADFFETMGVYLYYGALPKT